MTLPVADAQLRECEIPDNRHWRGAARITGTLLRSRRRPRSELTKSVQAPAIGSTTVGNATGDVITSTHRRVHVAPKHGDRDRTRIGSATAKLSETAGAPTVNGATSGHCAGVTKAGIKRDKPASTEDRHRDCT